MTSHEEVSEQHDPLLKFLRSMPDVGPNGFEGLVRDLLEQWTGFTFRLARSGSQFGRDGSSESHGLFSVAFEAKRYNESFKLKDRELAGELIQAHGSIPCLDLWILAATIEVGDSVENLRRQAEDLGVDLLILDARSNGFGALQIFCAEYPPVVAAFCQRNNGSAATKEIAEYIEPLRQSPQFHSAVERLRQSLSDSILCTASARKLSYNWLKSRVKNEKESRAAFSQDIGLLSIGDRLVTRKTIIDHFDTWWGKYKSDATICALLGEEGTGKTWALFSWLMHRFNDTAGPILLPVTASQQQKGSDIPEILIAVLQSRCGKSSEYWRKKVAAWLKRPKGEEPMVLLCFDGLNESPDFPWRKICDQSATEEVLGRIAIIVTARPQFWRYKVSIGISETVFKTDGYDDQELTKALEASGISLSDIPSSLQSLIRKPRYLDLVVRHFAALVKSGDMTVELLLYVDCKDKVQRKSNYPVSDDEFHAILCDLARQYHAGLKTVSRISLNQFLPKTDTTEAVLQEIIDGGLLIPAGSIEPVYKVEPRRLVHGLGMLLADHVQNEPKSTIQEMVDAIRMWLEPQPVMDVKASIVGAAVFFSIVHKNYSAVARRALLYFWVTIRNMPAQQEDDICAYLPDCAEDMFSIADDCWRNAYDNGMAHTRLAGAFLSRRDDERIKPILIVAVSRWMSYVNINGHPFTRGPNDINLSKQTEAIKERFGFNLIPDSKAKFQEWLFPITDDDGMLRLARFALLIISGGDRLSFVQAFVRWAISRRLMGNYAESEEAAWVLRLSDEELWPSFEPCLSSLVESGNETLRKAAHLLATCLGSKEALLLLSSRLSDLYPKNVWLIEYEQDPFASFWGSISREQCVPCMQRDDLSLFQIERKIEQHFIEPTIVAPQSYVARLCQAAVNLPVEGYNSRISRTIEDHNIEQLGSFLARFAPNDYCAMLRRAIHTLSFRDAEGKQQLLIHLPGIALTIRDAEKEIIAKALKELWEKSAEWSASEAGSGAERVVFAESLGFLALSSVMTSEELFETILLRPKHAQDLRSLELWFEPLPEETARSYLDQLLTETSNTTLTRLLWMLASSKPPLLDRHREQLRTFLDCDDANLRGSVYRFIYATQDTELIDYVFRKANSELPAKNSWEGIWHFEIIASISKNKRFDELLPMLRCLSKFATIIDRRGCNDEEVAKFVELFNNKWQNVAEQHGIATTGFPTICIEPFSDCGRQFKQKSLQEHDRSMVFLSAAASWGDISQSNNNDIKKFLDGTTDKQFAERHRAVRHRVEELEANEATSLWNFEIPIGLMRSICNKYADLINLWIDAALQSKSMLISCEGFYQSLCGAIVEANPTQGFELLKQLVASNNISFLDEYGCDYLSRIPFLCDSDEALEYRNSLLNSCRSDVDLIKIANVAVVCSRQEWLMKQVDAWIQSPLLWKRSIGLNLSCLSDLRLDIEKLIINADVNGTWVEPTLDQIRNSYSKNTWARHWYEQFLKVHDEDEAYSAYVLFLKCVDRRCRLWMRSFEDSPDVIDKRVRFRKMNDQQVKNAINNNEKIHKDRFLSIKIPKGQVFPFANSNNP
ncbi:MAG: hypothetical protein GQF41_0457 [Candidatus Rifleibacterium amylolyticum]|nr:MAG: hypothetical protein GQF41_0457 [Candidatus Rifleibacterium amylolyticum]